MKALRRRSDALFDGWVSPWPFAILRVGLAALVLLRTTVFDWLPMDHHDWVAGLEYHPATDAAEAPAFHSPLWPFLPPLGPGLTAALVWARTALAALLLVGVRPRVVAALLALVGYGLMAADRTRYLHHLHLLWLSVGLLALTPCGERLAPLRWIPWIGDGKAPRRWVPRWPLQLLRFHLIVVYLAAGLAKLDPRWLSGQTLEELHRAGLLGGPLVDGVLATIGARGLALLIVAIELILPLLLAIPRTRWLAIGMAVVFHLTIEASMMVSTFGATMLLLLVSFYPGWVKVPAMSDQENPA
jgi:uncharacterized membrane protein YphA (DoxX/SURF4 family)